MGFMDKAKKLADQAQEKLDDAQQEFNKRQGGAAEPGAEGARFDEHGRPEGGTSDAPPAGSTPPPPAEPAESSGGAGEKPREGGGSENPTPDPFKPIE